MRVIMFFVDGLGLGEPSAANPLVFADPPFMKHLLEGGRLVAGQAGFAGQQATLVAVDASLGVPGLPQSATGQTALFTGVNAPRLAGKHVKGFPNKFLRGLLQRRGLFARLRQAGYACAFLNAYRPSFFHLLEDGLSGQRFSCSTLITYYAGLPFRSLTDLSRGEALSMDITHHILAREGYSIPEITPQEAGRRLAALSVPYDFVLFEYFLTDRSGHTADREKARCVVQTLDAFLAAAFEFLDPEETLFILTSDHGNFEDLSHSRHTANPVPGLLAGPVQLRRVLAPSLRSLTDFLPAIHAALAWGEGER